MESFIYGEMNKATRLKDQSKIKFFGAFAAALSYIINYANKNQEISKAQTSYKLFINFQLKTFIPVVQIGLWCNDHII